MNARLTAFSFLIIVLSITWILINSITPIMETNGSPRGGFGPTNIGTVQVPSIGTGLQGIGRGLSGIGLFGVGIGPRGIGVKLPIAWNASSIYTPLLIPYIHIGTTNAELGNSSQGQPSLPSLPSLPLIDTPIIVPMLPIYASSVDYGNIGSPRSATGGGGGGAHGGGAGKGASQGSSIVESSDSTSNGNVKAIIVNEPWFFYLLMVILAILLVFSMVGIRGSLVKMRSRNEENDEDRKSRVKIEATKPEQKMEGHLMYGGEFIIKGSIVPLRGWGGSRYIELAIDTDLPLTWKINEPLKYTAKGASIELPTGNDVIGGNLIFHGIGCHEIKVKTGQDIVESHDILIVDDYASNVLDSFRANILRHGISDMEEKTPREICMELSRANSLNGIQCEHWTSLRIFELARYGHDNINRKLYEDFVHGLNNLRDAVVMGCPGETANEHRRFS